LSSFKLVFVRSADSHFFPVFQPAQSAVLIAGFLFLLQALSFFSLKLHGTLSLLDYTKVVVNIVFLVSTPFGMAATLVSSASRPLTFLVHHSKFFHFPLGVVFFDTRKNCL